MPTLARLQVCECAMTRAKLKLPNARACKHTYKCKSASTCACARVTFKYACTHNSLHTRTLASTRIDLAYLPIFPVVCFPCSHSTPFFAPPLPLFFFHFFQPLPKNTLIALFSAGVRSTCCKTLEISRQVQIILCQFNLRLEIRLAQSTFFDPIHHLIG